MTELGHVPFYMGLTQVFYKCCVQQMKWLLLTDSDINNNVTLTFSFVIFIRELIIIQYVMVGSVQIQTAAIV